MNFATESQRTLSPMNARNVWTELTEFMEFLYKHILIPVIQLIPSIKNIRVSNSVPLWQIRHFPTT